MDAAQLPDTRFVAVRQAATWTSLLVAAQDVDVVTTAVDNARGTIKSMAVSAQLLDSGGLAQLLESGGVALLLGAKLLLATAAAAALGLAALRIEQGSQRLSYHIPIGAQGCASCDDRFGVSLPEQRGSFEFTLSSN